MPNEEYSPLEEQRAAKEVAGEITNAAVIRKPLESLSSGESTARAHLNSAHQMIAAYETENDPSRLVSALHDLRSCGATVVRMMLLVKRLLRRIGK